MESPLATIPALASHLTLSTTDRALGDQHVELIDYARHFTWAYHSHVQGLSLTEMSFGKDLAQIIAGARPFFERLAALELIAPKFEAYADMLKLLSCFSSLQRLKLIGPRSKQDMTLPIVFRLVDAATISSLFAAYFQPYSQYLFPESIDTLEVEFSTQYDEHFILWVMYSKPNISHLSVANIRSGRTITVLNKLVRYLGRGLTNISLVFEGLDWPADGSHPYFGAMSKNEDIRCLMELCEKRTVSKLTIPMHPHTTWSTASLLQSLGRLRVQTFRVRLRLPPEWVEGFLLWDWLEERIDWSIESLEVELALAEQTSDNRVAAVEQLLREKLKAYDDRGTLHFFTKHEALQSL
ncbi:hypothetical protein C8J56DRAFT_1057574 [Mycena floridula]|nr:hypothetical protein C8J56DRAFT_1057574 [Mycena floridula]